MQIKLKCRKINKQKGKYEYISREEEALTINKQKGKYEYISREEEAFTMRKKGEIK